MRRQPKKAYLGADLTQEGDRLMVSRVLEVLQLMNRV